MRISEIGGEFGFIERIRGPHAAAKRDGLAVPLGDDAAVLDAPAGHQIVVTTDMLVEGVHFRRDWSDPYSIGWKAAAVNLSDIAAMGADPTYAFLSLGLCEQDTVESLDRLYDGFTDCLHRYGAGLAGGDTNSSPQGLVLSVTQLGSVAAGRALTRGGARVGDALLVTGNLGDAAGGLRLLLEHGPAKAEKINRDLVGAHRRPHPRVLAARAALGTAKVHAAMDVSDGLAGDLPKLCGASGVGARIELGKLPVSEALRTVSELLGWSAAEIALAGGEDYELLLSVAASDAEDVRAVMEAVGVPSSVIGEVTRVGVHVVALDGGEAELPARSQGWDHFAS